VPDHHPCAGPGPARVVGRARCRRAQPASSQECRTDQHTGREEMRTPQPRPQCRKGGHPVDDGLHWLRTIGVAAGAGKGICTAAATSSAGPERLTGEIRRWRPEEIMGCDTYPPSGSDLADGLAGDLAITRSGPVGRSTGRRKEPENWGLAGPPATRREIGYVRGPRPGQPIGGAALESGPRSGRGGRCRPEPERHRPERGGHRWRWPVRSVTTGGNGRVGSRHPVSWAARAVVTNHQHPGEAPGRESNVGIGTRRSSRPRAHSGT